MRSFFRLLFRKRSHTIPILVRQPRQMSTSSAAALLYAATVSLPSTAGSRPDDEVTTSKKHHMKNGRYENPWPSWSMNGPGTILWGMASRRLRGTGNVPDTTPPTVPVRKPTFLPGHEAPAGDKLRATWLGHACYYAEFPSGLRVLFDPVFTDRCSPLSWLGPKRFTEMPCQIKDIPTIDAVVISHSHYDHLSLPTVQEIRQLHPNCHFFVPLGNKSWFEASGIYNVTELDWWDEVDLTLNPTQPGNRSSITTTTSTSSSRPASDINAKSTAKHTAPPSPPLPSSSPTSITARISCLPSQHIANRGLFDRGCTLWASWSVTSTATPQPTSTNPPTPPRPISIYFAGDTGYRSVPRDSTPENDYSPAYAHLPHCPAFAAIGAHRGPFTLGLIPIGAYAPRWIMSPMHANPRDSVEIFLDTKCDRALGMHWGTWVLTEEDVLEPPRQLREALKLKGVEEEGRFDVVDIGEGREF